MQLSRIALFASLVSTTACLHRGADDEDLLAVETTTDASTSSQDEGSLLASAVDGANAPAADAPTPAGVASYIANHAPQRFSPAGCATAALSGSSVTLTFAGCTGPRGLRQIDGTLSVNVTSAASGSIAIAASANDFQIGGATVDVDATATYDGSSLSVVTHSSGVGPLGREIVHDGDYTLSWTAMCASLKGAWSTEVGDAGRSTTADVKRCANMCPTGTVSRTTFRQRTFTVTFDGTPTARWSSSAGRSGTFQLPCQ
jgi:hypothetical protein